MIYQLIVYVPESHKESLKAALFEAGAGRYDHYDCCCFETKGKGQFRPLAGSDPFIGSPGGIETVAEVKLELICTAAAQTAVRTALVATHPYETPAYVFIACET